MLSADPHVAACAGYRIHDVAIQARVGDAADHAVVDPEQSAGRRRKPRASSIVDVHGSDWRRRQALRGRERGEDRIPPSLDAAIRADPDVAVPILEHRRHVAAIFAARCPAARPSTIVYPHQSIRSGGDPHVARTIANHRERLKVGQLARKPRCADRCSRPPCDALVGPDPHFAVFHREQAVHFQVRQPVCESRHARALDVNDAGAARAEPELAGWRLRHGDDERRARERARVRDDVDTPVAGNLRAEPECRRQDGVVAPSLHRRDDRFGRSQGRQDVLECIVPIAKERDAAQTRPYRSIG